MWFDFYAECSYGIDAQVSRFNLIYANIQMKSVFCYKQDLKSKKTMFVSVNSLFSLINVIKTESNNLLSNHIYHGP